MHERRTTDYLYSYWSSLKINDYLPIESSIDLNQIQHLWQYCYLLDNAQLINNQINYNYLGQEINSLYKNQNFKLIIQQIEIQMNKALLEINRSKEPLFIENTLIYNKGLFKYRQCLLPFTHHTNQVDYIFGSIRWLIESLK